MVSILVIFYTFVFLLSVIGFMRGWAMELLVSFSVILALALIALFETSIPVVNVMIVSDPTRQFWIRSLILVVLVFFGYQSPRISRLSGAARRERISDALLGVFIGAINGYLIFGTFWYYLHQAGYPGDLITAPQDEASLRLLTRMLPVWLNGNRSYVAVMLSFLFVLVVFL